MQTKCAKNVIEHYWHAVQCYGKGHTWRQTKHKTQDEDKQNTKHRIKTIKTQNTGLRQAKHKAQDEDKQNTGWRQTKHKAQDVMWLAKGDVIASVKYREVFSSPYF
jgi:alkaline phosphatase